MKRRCVKTIASTLTAEGYTIGRFENKEVNFWGALPGEEVWVELKRRKKRAYPGEIVKVSKPHPSRVHPAEDHYASCGPWQVFGYKEEALQKTALAKNIFAREAGLKEVFGDIYTDGQMYGYRNKMEFSFYGHDDGMVSLALHKRWGKGMAPLDSCALADEKINTCAAFVIDLINSNKIGREELKTLLVRSDSSGKVTAALFVKSEAFATHIFADTNLNIQVYYSNPLSPASVPTRLIFEKGDFDLREDLLGVPVRFRPLSFFQVNVPVFEQALRVMETHVEGEDIVDYYSGVGSIGLALSSKAGKAVLVEVDAGAISLARQTIKENNLSDRYEAVAKPSEMITEEIKPDRTIILDPPRAGLHYRLIKTLLDVRPQKLIYLSCNIKTQAQNLKDLAPAYDILEAGLFNFFPRTPHIESLVVLKRKP